MYQSQDIPACRIGSGKGRILRHGKPVAGTSVRLEQKSHAFLFGCNAFDLLDKSSPYDLSHEESEAAHALFMDQFGEVFNFATLPFYWGTFEPVEGEPLTAELMTAARRLKDAGHTLKGHPLCWHTECAKWLMKYDIDTIHTRQMDRIHREVSAFKGLINSWDVINETVIMPVFDKYDNAVTRLCNHLGRERLLREVFAAVRAENTSSILVLNDFDVTPAYEEVIERSLDEGVDFDVIGIQSHMHQGYWGMEMLQDVLDRFSRFGKPLHFSELTILSGDTFVPRELDDLNDHKVEDWPSTPAGEERQAKQVREFYTALFEHPSVEAITWWDFSDGNWLNAPSGLVRKDRTPKPAFEALRTLVREDWWTPVQTLTTDSQGEFHFRGYFGRYEAFVEGDPYALEFPGPYQQAPSEKNLETECVIELAP
jgi:GH35 family endo-1,4-beta-xylanase